MFVENWDRDYLQDQENVIGRSKVSGAPLTGGTEFTAPRFTAAGDDGTPAIPAHAHIRLASHENNGGTRILRRGYSYTDGIDPQAGTLVGGLFFIAFMKDPGQFVKLQNSPAADASHRAKLVGLAGFEPATSATQTRRASQTALQPVLRQFSGPGQSTARVADHRSVRDLRSRVSVSQPGRLPGPARRAPPRRAAPPPRRCARGGRP